jgi:hypothetical protein
MSIMPSAFRRSILVGAATFAQEDDVDLADVDAPSILAMGMNVDRALSMPLLFRRMRP